jgi:hypothetical protein
MPDLPSTARRYGLLLLLALPACTPKGKERMDAMWYRYDPVGHRRYHREKYYPHEPRTGLRLPDGM